MKVDPSAGAGPLPRLLGGRLSLDFANTVDPRHADQPHEFLAGPSAWLRWAAHAGALSEAEVRLLQGRSNEDPHAAEIALDEALRLRSDVYDVASTVLADRVVPSAQLGRIEATALDGLQGRRLVTTDAGFAWGWGPDVSLRTPLQRVAVDFTEFVTGPQVSRLRECAGEDGCDWLFLDHSKNGSRRWCSMLVCGNQAKSRRYRANHPAAS